MGKGRRRQEMIDFDLFGKPIIPKIDIIRIPYQGSKNSIALDLFAKMLELKPKAKYFYDLTGGGGAMAFTALQLGLQVFYNEKNTSLVNFIKWTFKRIRTGEKSIYGIFPEEFYNFIDRANFKELVKEDSYLGQFARICYSFGNNQRDYLFGGEIEELKHFGHDIVMFRCGESLKKFNEATNSNLILSNAPTWNQRRFDFMGQFSTERRGKKGERLQEMHQLEQLQRLQQLQRLERRIQFTNLDYSEMIINTPEAETIIYLDPPYRGTTKYAEVLNHDELDAWFRNLPYLAFMSEYSAPFKSVLEIKKAQLMDNSQEKKNYVLEKLYVNCDGI